MRLVVIESPFAGDVERNIAFARAVCRWAVLQGVAPYASHLFYTQPGILDDDNADERRLGIDAGLAWGALASEAWFCLREGAEPSRGMRYGLERHRNNRTPCRFFYFDDTMNARETNASEMLDATIGA